MDRLSGLDASFLYLESSAQLLHVCGVIVLDPETDPGRLRLRQRSRTSSSGASTAYRCSTASSSRCRSASTTRSGSTTTTSTSTGTCTGWRCPRPAATRELADLCGHMAGIPLDRSRPLWEFVVIEGLESGKVAIFTKMHHCTVDGVSGANAISFLCSLEPDAPPLETAPKDGVERVRRATPSCSRAVSSPTSASRWRSPSWSDRPPACVTKTIGRARSGTAMAAPLRAPRTSFNGTITGHRTVAIEDMSLDKIKEIKNAVDGRDRQRRRAHPVRRCAAALPRGARRAARDLAGRLGAGLGARRRRRSRAAATRSPRSSPGSAPTSRTRSTGWPRSPRATPTPRTTTRRSRPTPSRTGRSSRRRAPSASPYGWSPRCGWPTPAR